jgi:hypothetical protein
MGRGAAGSIDSVRRDCPLAEGLGLRKVAGDVAPGGGVVRAKDKFNALSL